MNAQAQNSAPCARIQSTVVADLMAAWLDGRPAPTVRAYELEIRRFARWHGMTVHEALSDFLQSSAHANRTTLAFVADLRRRGLAAATVNRSVTALRSIAKTARLIGCSDALIDVATQSIHRPKPRTPAADDVRKFLRALRSQATNRTGVRNYALVLVMAIHGLRRAEVAGLDLRHYDGRAIEIRGKGRGGQRDRIVLVAEARRALDAWLGVRGECADEAVFVGLRGRTIGSRLTGCGIYRLLRKIGASCGWDGLRPHLMRRAAITAALDANGGDVRSAQQFARHTNPTMTLHYDSCRRDLHAQNANAVASSLLG